MSARRSFDLHRAERTATRRVERVATAVVVLALMAARQVVIRTPRRSR